METTDTLGPVPPDDREYLRDHAVDSYAIIDLGLGAYALKVLDEKAPLDPPPESMELG